MYCIRRPLSTKDATRQQDLRGSTLEMKRSLRSLIKHKVEKSKTKNDHYWWTRLGGK